MRKHTAILFLFVCSALSLLLAPLLMPESYDWIAHTTSESGAQGVAGAWLARTGFVLYGLAVFLLIILKSGWTGSARIIHVIFSVAMIGNAVFSSRPWRPEFSFDVLEDTLHSWMSGIVGTAFTLGVLIVLLNRSRADRLTRSFDWLAIVTSIVITVLMLSGVESYSGLIQRVMFAVSYVWYIRESLKYNNQDQTE